MKKILRIIFLVVLAFIIGIAIFRVHFLYRSSWKKTQTANELETILEEKYGTDVEVLESYITLSPVVMELNSKENMAKLIHIFCGKNKWIYL